MTADQVSDFTDAPALPGSLPDAEWLIAGQCYRAIVRYRSEDDGKDLLVPGQPLGTVAYGHASPAGRHVGRRSATTSDETGSRLCSTA